MNYSLELSGFAEEDEHDIEIIPSEGVINEESSTKLEVRFLPRKLQKYEGSIVVNVANVGNNLLTLPIEADCIVPKVICINLDSDSEASYFPRKLLFGLPIH